MAIKVCVAGATGWVGQILVREIVKSSEFTLTGAIGIFAVHDDGGLVSLGQQDGLSASAGINGIAAY